MALNECWCWKKCKNGIKEEAGHCGAYPDDCSCCANFPDPCENGSSNSFTLPKRPMVKKGISRMRSATGLSEKQVGGTMALYAYLGTALGTYAAMRYLGVLNKSTHKIGIAGAMIFAGLALGSKIGAIRVEQKRSK